MAIHCQLLFATCLYLLEFVNSIIELSTVIIGKSKLNGTCFLFVSSKGPDFSYLSTCDVQTSICGAAAIYCAIMIIYHGRGTYIASKDNHIGRTMWVMPWLLINSFLVIVTFIGSCAYSVGLYMSCNGEEGQTVKFRCSSDGNEFKPMLIGEISTWISALLWILLVIIEGVRLGRNRRARGREVYVEPTTSDVVNIGSVIPST